MITRTYPDSLKFPGGPQHSMGHGLHNINQTDYFSFFSFAWADMQPEPSYKPRRTLLLFSFFFVPVAIHNQTHPISYKFYTRHIHIIACLVSPSTKEPGMIKLVLTHPRLLPQKRPKWITKNHIERYAQTWQYIPCYHPYSPIPSKLTIYISWNVRNEHGSYLT